MEVLISREQIGLRLVEIIRDHTLDFLVFQYVLLPIAQYMLLPIAQYMLAQIKYYLLAPMWLRLGFLLDYSSNMRILRTKLEELSIIRIEVQGQVNAAENNGEVILPRVKKWQESANKFTEGPMNLLDNELHLNPMVRCQRSKSAKEKTAEVDQLIRKVRSFDSLSTFESRKSIYEGIIRALKDSEPNMIGILGMRGVGKTFLAREIYEAAKDGDGDPFEEVVMATVSWYPDLKTIQCEIAQMLGLRFSGPSMARVAQQLSNKLDGKKRILIILDDIHQKVQLEAVGIRFRERFKGCKVVLVYRSQAVYDQLDTEMDFTIEALDEDEKWKLFRRMAGLPVSSEDPSAVQAARNCEGLPEYIIKAAIAWKNNAALNF